MLDVESGWDSLLAKEGRVSFAKLGSEVEIFFGLELKIQGSC